MDEAEVEETSVAEQPKPEQTTSRAWHKPAIGLFWTVVLVLVVVFVNQQISLPYFVLAPGGARPVNSAIQIPQDHEYPPKGKLLYTTVSLIQAHPFDILWSQFDSQDEIQKRKAIIGDSTPKEYLEQNNLSMDESRMIATSVAMKKAGYNVTQLGDGASIKFVKENTPAAGKLNAGETIIAIGGKPVKVGSDVTSLVRAAPSGSKLAFDVKAADGKTRTVDLMTAERPDTPAGRPKVSYVGVSVQTLNPRIDTPFPVKVDLGAVGGPSAGLAMSVALLDELTPGELTGGKEIAATGTIDLDGNVGEVGGVKQKVAAVRRDSKARVFIVPRSEEEMARRYAGKNLKVVGVDNLDQAVSAIVAAGGEEARPAVPKR